MTMRLWCILAVVMAMAAPVMAAEPATADKGAADDARWSELFKGKLTIYLEGNASVPFASDVTFEKRVRISDKEYVVFKGENTTLIIRTQQIIAVKSSPAK